MYVDPHICSDSHLCFPHIHLSRKKAMCLQRQIFFFLHALCGGSHFVLDGGKQFVSSTLQLVSANVQARRYFAALTAGLH